LARSHHDGGGYNYEPQKAVSGKPKIMTNQFPITILGTGNVARALGFAFSSAGNTITQVWGRNQDKAIELAIELQSSVAEDIGELIQHDGIYIIAVSDHAIESVARQMPAVQGVVAHTSGSTYMKVLSDIFPHSGVFYPLQTFSRLNPPDIKKVPFIVQGSDDFAQKKLEAAAILLGASIFMMSEEQRIRCHLSAVMVNNFSNHLIALAEDYLNNHGLPPILIYPLLEQTVHNAINNYAEKVQTGPARRGDQVILDAHLTLLEKEENPFLKQLYQLFSDSIQAYYAPPK
jgi:predicted short-subunit dehydrogenase-like oxidoreductase (DUF2520 family)